jgi:hypothetical protein
MTAGGWFARKMRKSRRGLAQMAAFAGDRRRTAVVEARAGRAGASLEPMSLLLSALPAPLDFLDWGFLMGPLGLILIGAGAMALRMTSAGEADEI